MASIDSARVPSPTISIGYRECCSLIRLESDFLRKYDIPNRQLPLGPEAPDSYSRTTPVKLIDVHLPAVTNAIPLSAMAADDFEKPVALVLRELRR